MGYLYTKDSVAPSSNVYITIRNRQGLIVGRRESHNIFVNQGRQWLRNHMAATTFAGIPVTANQNVCDGDPIGNADALSVVGKTFKPRYIGIGVKGALQTVLPAGSQTENAEISALELPVKTANGQWLKEVLPHDNLASVQQFPTAYSVRFRAIFGYNEISFANQPTYGTNVPISEVALYTSEAGQNDEPTNTGLIAYNIFAPVSKTPNFVLEIAWDLRV